MHGCINNETAQQILIKLCGPLHLPLGLVTPSPPQKDDRKRNYANHERGSDSPHRITPHVSPGREAFGPTPKPTKTRRTHPTPYPPSLAATAIVVSRSCVSQAVLDAVGASTAPGPPGPQSRGREPGGNAKLQHVTNNSRAMHDLGSCTRSCGHRFRGHHYAPRPIWARGRLDHGP